MSRWMMKFEVEGDLGVEADRGELVFRHPSGSFEVRLRNHEMAAGVETPLLHMFLLFDSNDLLPRSAAFDQVSASPLTPKVRSI